MKPGPELDALIAEKVMGCKTGWRGDYEWQFCNCDSGEHGRASLKEYSTDIGAAWEVVEKVRMSVAVPGSCDGEGCMYSSYNALCFSAEGEVVFEWGETMPYVICLAALKSVGYRFY